MGCLAVPDLDGVPNEASTPAFGTPLVPLLQARGYALARRCWSRSLRVASCGCLHREASERIREIGERVVAEHGEALQILADHDPESAQG